MPAKNALADVGKSDIDNASYTFQDGANIIGDFGQGGKVTFTDVNSTDSTRNYTPPKSSGFCDPGDMSGKDGKIKFGINIDKSADLTAATVAAKIKLGFTQGVNCSGVISYQNIDNSSAVGATDYQWDGDNITSLSGSKTQTTFTPAQGVTAPLYMATNGDPCGVTDAILLASAGGNSGTYYSLSPTLQRGNQSNLSSYKALNSTGALNNNCYVDSSKSVTIAGKQGSAAVSSTGGQTATDTQTADTCYLNSTWSLAWLACPALEAASTLANKLIDLFEDQLSFRVSDLSSNNGQQSLKTAWTIFKDIASAVFVIIMLVMVISEAIGVGPFDAYTVRKMLPKLIVAIIFMQLSWAFLAWVVDFFDDVGKGLADLMYLPFGGTAKMQFGSLLSQAGVNGLGAATVGWGGLIAGIGTAAFAPFSVLMAAFTAVSALLVGLATLIFRKILIMLCLLLSPVAFAAWVIPGTKKYFDLWYSNFTKSLAMFPLVVGFIAAGRIFAFVSGTQENGLIGFIIVLVGYFGPMFMLPKCYKWGGSLMQTAGNGIGSAYNKTVGERSKKWIDSQRAAQKEWKARDASKRLATGEYRAHGWRGLVLNRAGVTPIRKGFDRLITGTTPVTETNRRKFKKIQDQAEAYRAEDLKEETARFSTFLEGFDRGDHDKMRRAIMLGEKIKVNDINGDEVDFDGEQHVKNQGANEHLRVDAAATMAAQMGGEQHMKAITEWVRKVESSGTVEQKREMQRYLQHNVGQLFGKMPSLYKTIDGAATEPPETIAGMSGTEIENIIADLSTRIASSDPDVSAKAQKLMDTFMHNLSEAASNENLRGRLNQTGLKAARAYIAHDMDIVGDGENPAAGTVNSSRKFNDGNKQDVEMFNLMGRINADGITPEIAAKYRDTLVRLVNQDGSINRSAGASPVGAGTMGAGGETEITIEHSAAPVRMPAGTIDRDTIARMGDENVQRWVESGDRGWGTLADQDLMAIYNTTSGETQARARAELEHRGAISPRDSGPSLPG